MGYYVVYSYAGPPLPGIQSVDGIRDALGLAIYELMGEAGAADCAALYEAQFGDEIPIDCLADAPASFLAQYLLDAGYWVKSLVVPCKVLIVSEDEEGVEEALSLLPAAPSPDDLQLQKIIVACAARIKDPSYPWPEERTLYQANGYRYCLDMTPEKRLRRVVITSQVWPSLRITLIDANPEKVKSAAVKVMVYYKVGPGPERVGQVRFGGPRPELVMFE